MMDRHGKEMRENLLNSLYVIIALVVFLCSCSNNNENREVEKESENSEQLITETTEFEHDENLETGSDLPEVNYDFLNIEIISIYEDQSGPIDNNMEYNLNLVNEIKERNDINNLISFFDIKKWEKVPLEDEYSAIPYYYVSLNNGTMISLISDEAYGYIMSYEYNIDTQRFKLDNIQGPFIMPDEIYEIIVSDLNAGSK